MELFVESTTTTSVNTLTLKIPPANAFNGTAILVIVIHFSLSTALITIPHPLLPSHFFAALPVTPYRLAHLGIRDAFDRDLRFPSVARFAK